MPVLSKDTVAAIGQLAPLALQLGTLAVQTVRALRDEGYEVPSVEELEAVTDELRALQPLTPLSPQTGERSDDAHPGEPSIVVTGDLRDLLVGQGFPETAVDQLLLTHPLARDVDSSSGGGEG